ncbi:MAG: hypothetical protein EXS09_20815 [Gemmataceae bacterium]|nr:hypothetical protein [Gemmataceae bacterium]
MEAAFIVTSLLTCLTGLVLLRRLAKAARQVRLPIVGASAPDPIGLQAQALVLGAIDETLLPSGNASGLEEVEVQFREAQDPYRTVPELVRHIDKLGPSRRYADLMSLIKMVYQLQDALQLPVEKATAALTILAERLRATDTAPRPVAKVEFVPIGTLLDTGRMIYVNSGTHVRQPFGVVVYDADAKVIGKAKVMCQ